MRHIVFFAVRPKNKDDAVDLELALLKILSGDPSYEVEIHEDSGETIVRAPTELQLEALAGILKRELPIKAAIGPPQVVYKETITQPAEGEGQFVQRSGAGGLYAHAKIRIAPAEPGNGYSFASTLADDVIPDQFVQAVDRGIRSQLTCGSLAYPVDDIRVELCDGSYHQTDSSETAFEMAGAMAVQAAEQKARPIVIEPIVKAEVVVPNAFMGDVIADLTIRRAAITGMRSHGDGQFISATVPLTEVLGYANFLRRQTDSRASYSMQFDRYAPVPDSDEPDDEDRIAPIMAPLKPSPGGRHRSVALPEPE